MADCLTVYDFERLQGGSLPGGERRRLEEHLHRCAKCRSAHQRFLSDDRILGQVRGALQVDRVDETFGAGDDAGSKSAAHFPSIAGYDILRIIGRGGMGVVYEAVQTKLNRKVALKLLPAFAGAANPDLITRFQREATAAAKLHHTHIIPIYDFGESRDGYFFAMELVDGTPLNTIIARQGSMDDHVAPSPASDATVGVRETAPLWGASPSARSDRSASVIRTVPGRSGARARYAQAARWIADAADALHYAHGNGIIHRDIKPANLILAHDGRIMIADFGLAKTTGEQSVTMTGSIIGTLRYMSPEQIAAGELPVDARTDVYSLGATLYELLTFQPIFAGVDHEGLLARIPAHEPTKPRKIIPSIPAELETITLKALEKKASDRFPTAKALADDLRRYLNDLPIVAKRPGPVRRAMKFVKRHRAPVAVTCTAVLVVVATVLWIAASRRAQVQRLDQLIADGVRRTDDGRREPNVAAHWTAAAEAFEQALADAPHDHRALGNYARMKKDQYNARPGSPIALLEEARTLCDQALAVAPDNFAVLNIKGVVLKKLGETERRPALLDEAAATYRRALAADPGFYHTRVNLAQIHALRGKLDEAVEEIERATTDAGDERHPRAINAWRTLGALQLHLGNPRAPASIENAMQCNKSDPWPWVLRALLRMEWSGYVDLEAALDDAKAAATRDDERQPDPRIRRVRALAYLRNGRYDKAAIDAHTALDRGGEPTVNHLILAIAEARRGNLPSAREHLDAARAAWPADLTADGGFIVSAAKGVLWFERARDRITLRDQAERLIQSSRP